MAELPEHSHCKFCGEPIPSDEKYCSEECVSLYETRTKRESRKEIGFFALALLAVAAITAALYLLR
ncbi:MAG: DUF2116 family Zn-ribbon domain-containing protein [Methanomassiliicoccaceae archaeon]|nr:DUF2116 family Zn-ribbon domain-containing protein [Methanomassiliicoccaceae archaeon]